MSRILIVEDLVAGREAMAKLLQREGYEVAGARNGAEALARLKEGGIDLVLLDHMMPEVDGLTFLSGIRRFPKWKNLPVIMFTGLKDRNHLMKAQTMGVKEYMVKSEYTMQDLLAQVRKYVQPAPPPPAEPPATTAAPVAG
jgi:CheY-like chemotaxis protein